MRIWSIHPKYLDAKGIVALWRETLLAKKVLEGNTTGYKNHPQLIRFKMTKNPSACINRYLAYLYYEAINRGYKFDRNKINWDFDDIRITVTSEQLKYEFKHLLKKLELRDIQKYEEIKNIIMPETHPIFKVIEGKIEEWEIIKNEI